VELLHFHCVSVEGPASRPSNVLLNPPKPAKKKKKLIATLSDWHVAIQTGFYAKQQGNFWESSVIHRVSYSFIT
jgi:hypothetical protein